MSNAMFYEILKLDFIGSNVIYTQVDHILWWITFSPRVRIRPSYQQNAVIKVIKKEGFFWLYKHIKEIVE
jgi:hypothetical protein